MTKATIEEFVVDFSPEVSRTIGLKSVKGYLVRFGVNNCKCFCSKSEAENFVLKLKK